MRMISRIICADIFYNLLVKSGNCLRGIYNKFKRKRGYHYTPIHLMRTEIEIETLLEENNDLPQVRFIPVSPEKKMDESNLDLRAIDSHGNITSCDFENNTATVVSESGFYSPGEEDEESEDEDAIFRALEEDDNVMEFFHNTNVL